MIIRSSHGNKRPIRKHYEGGHEIANNCSVYRSLDDRANLLALKSGYIMTPSAQQIYHNKFLVQNLEIVYGDAKVKWNGIVDLRKMKAPLKDLIELGKTSIEVYPN